MSQAKDYLPFVSGKLASEIISFLMYVCVRKVECACTLVWKIGSQHNVSENHKQVKAYSND